MKKRTMNILVTMDGNYIVHFNVMLVSLIHSNPDCCFEIYILHSSLSEGLLDDTKKILGDYGRIILLQADDLDMGKAPVSERYLKEIYYRIFASRYLPRDLDRILYLDPDIIVNGSLKNLYEISMEKYYFAAATHNEYLMRKINK